MRKTLKKTFVSDVVAYVVMNERTREFYQKPTHHAQAVQWLKEANDAMKVPCYVLVCMTWRSLDE